MGAPGDFIVFADESGDHGLGSINRDYPVFVLACCIFEKKQYVDCVCPEFQRFKLRWWAHDAVVLHSSQIKRQQPPFAFLTHVETRARFMSDLAGTLADAPFAIIAATIDKCRLREEHPRSTDVYSLALRHCVENVVAFMDAHGQRDRDIPFLIERRGKMEDRQLVAAFRDICDGGTCWGELPNLSIDLIDKKANMTGLQIADLVSTPIGRHMLGPREPNRAFEVIRRKIWLPSQLREGEGRLIAHPGK